MAPVSQRAAMRFAPRALPRFRIRPLPIAAIGFRAAAGEIAETPLLQARNAILITATSANSDTGGDAVCAAHQSNLSANVFLRNCPGGRVFDVSHIQAPVSRFQPRGFA